MDRPWWLTRHRSWQAVRQKDVCQEKEKKEDALSKLTTREREIRKRIEDIVDPQERNCADSDKAAAKLPSAKQTNGSNRGKTHVDTSKKGKKRKAPS
jgi:COMPASS component SPP1